MPGLVSYTQSLAVPSATGTKLDIARELGLTQAQLQFDQRTKALVHPDDYKNERNVQFQKMIAAVQNTYDEVGAELKTSGLPMLHIQQLAINAAAATKAVQEGILESLFPSGSTAVAMQADGVRAGQFTGMLSAPSAAMSSRAPRRAPRRKATRKRK
jgi:hypothetical protein